jgi:prepilin signal peptidase PulO-like enzyme (type II secretory pathway)
MKLTRCNTLCKRKELAENVHNVNVDEGTLIHFFRALNDAAIDKRSKLKRFRFETVAVGVIVCFLVVGSFISEFITEQTEILESKAFFILKSIAKLLLILMIVISNLRTYISGVRVHTDLVFVSFYIRTIARTNYTELNAKKTLLNGYLEHAERVKNVFYQQYAMERTSCVLVLIFIALNIMVQTIEVVLLQNYLVLDTIYLFVEFAEFLMVRRKRIDE